MRRRTTSYRYRITATLGDPGVAVGSVIQDHRYQGKTHEWLIYNLADMTLRASFTGELIERVAVHNNEAPNSNE